MNYQRKNPMQEVDSKLKTFSEFFLKVKALKDELSSSSTAVSENWNSKDKQLNSALLSAKHQVHNCLKNNFDTPNAIEHLLDIVSKGNVYLTGNNEKKYLLLARIKEYVLEILSIFGIDMEESGISSSTSGSREDIARPFAKVIFDFRNKVRLGVKNKEGPGYFIGLCDDIRENAMPELGVKFTDDDEFGVYFVDKEILLAERAKNAIAKKEGIRLAKEKSIKSREEKLATWEKAKIEPKEWIKKEFDVDINSPEEIPAKNLSGKDISQKQKKNIAQAWAKQADLNQKLAAELSKKIRIS